MQLFSHRFRLIGETTNSFAHGGNMMTTHSTSLLGTTLGLGLVGALALTACDERATFQDGEVSETESSEKETPPIFGTMMC